MFRNGAYGGTGEGRTEKRLREKRSEAVGRCMGGGWWSKIEINV